MYFNLIKCNLLMPLVRLFKISNFLELIIKYMIKQ
jgi:hypothetical protein